MRRIDLCCKLLAPALAGVILHYVGIRFTTQFVTTIFIAAWNILSFFGELGLLYLVYMLVPALRVKRVRNSTTVNADQNIELEEDININQLQEDEQTQEVNM